MSFVLRRLVQAFITIWVIATLVFFLLRLSSGDPTATVVDPSFPVSVRNHLLQMWGLDRSLPEQYLNYLSRLGRGDFGVSFYTQQSVMGEVLPKALNTLILGVAGLLLAYIVGIVAGTLMASRRGRLADSMGLFVTVVLRSTPEFWLGLLALQFFSFRHEVFPDSGIRGVGFHNSNLWSTYISSDFLLHLLLPTIVAAAQFLALPLLLTRGAVVEALESDYVAFAYAKGMKRTRVLFAYAMRNALIPVITEGAASVGLSLGSLVAIEVVFSWPGVGREIVLAVSRNDYPVAQGAFLLMAGMVVVMNFVADCLYGVIDPRIRLGSKAGPKP